MASMSNTGIIEMPQPMDIILGRGKRYLKHPGNVIFKDLIWTNRHQYVESSFAGKKSIIDTVINTIQNKGGRFIRIKDNGWSIIPLKACRLKIAHAFNYHFRTEFSQDKSIPIPYDEYSSGSQRQLSYYTRIVEDLRAKLSWLHAQQVASEFTETNSSIGNIVHLYPYKSNVHQAELLAREKGDKEHGREFTCTEGIYPNVVSPFVVKKVAQPLLLNCDSTMKDRHVPTFPLERTNCCPQWKDELDHSYDTCESLPQEMPSTLFNVCVNPGMRPFQPLTHEISTNADSSSTPISASMPVLPDTMNHGQYTLYPTESFCNPISERAHSYFLTNMNMNSSDYYYKQILYGSPNLLEYHTINAVNVHDMSTGLDRPFRYDSNGKSDIPDDFIDDDDDDEVSQISAWDGDFHAFPIDP